MNSSFSIKEMIMSVVGIVTRETTPYVYLLIERSSGNWYIGSRVANGCHPRELGMSYFTSSKTVKPLFKANPSKFVTSILYIGHDAVLRESQFLKAINAKASGCSYNLQNGDGKFDPKKAAEITVSKKLGVHARSASQMTLDSTKMVNIHRPAKTGIFTPGAAERGRKTQALLGLAAFDPKNRSKGGVTSGNNAKFN
ncbi:MAG: hypothetical protein ACR2IJ_02150, partial [Fluviibacter sp.]